MVGQADILDRSKPPKDPDIAPYVSLVPGLAQWIMPPTSDAAVKESLLGQSDRRVEVPPPSDEIIEDLTEIALTKYPLTKTPRSLRPGRDGRIQWKRVRGRLKHIFTYEIVHKSTPGFPLNKFGQNSVVLDKVGLEMLVDITVGRMKALLSTSIPDDPVAIVQQELADVVSLFIKPEPHGTGKQESKRWRLISMIALIDQAIDRLLHNGQNKFEIAVWKYIPSMPGLGLSSTEDGKIFLKVLKRQSGLQDPSEGTASADVSGFDWSIQEWEIMWDANVRIRLMIDCPPYVATLIRARAHILCRSVFLTPGGTLYSQVAVGVVKSGTFNTSSTNSRIRAMLAWLVGSAWALTMGDDCLEEPVDDAAAKYLALGHKLKMYEVGGKLNFCSFYFRPDGSYYSVDPSKSLYHFLAKPTEDAYHSLVTHFGRHPDSSNLLKALGLARETLLRNSPSDAKISQN